jgi:hypothetical protein
VFLPIFHVQPCVSHFPHLSDFSPFSKSYSVWVSFTMFFSFLTIIQVLWCKFTIWYVFQGFSQYSRSYNICVSFYTFFSFLAIIHTLQCVFLIFHDFHCHIPDPTVCVSHFACFSVFLAIFQVIHCLCPFPRLSVFFPQSRSYSVYFSYFTFITVSCPIPGPTVGVSFYMFFFFPAIIQVLQCAFLIFHLFRCFSPYSRSYSVCVSFSTFFSFPAIIQVLLCTCLIFHVFQCFSQYAR